MTLHVGSVGSPIRANTMEPEVLRQVIAGDGRSSPGSGLAQGIVGAGSLAVTQNGTPNMSVNVGAGFAYVAGTNNPPVQGVYNVYNDATVNLALAASNATNPRVDVVCVTIQDAYYSGSTNTGLLQVITGTPAASPAVPAVPANSLVLAHIYVGANASSITNSYINVTTGAGNPDTLAFVPLVFPPGVIGQTVGTANTASSTATASPGVLVATVNVNVNANRRVRVTWNGRLNQGGTEWVEIHRDTASGIGFCGMPSGGANCISYFCYDTPLAGVHQYGVYIWGNSTATYFLGGGSGTVIDQWNLTVEDVGPTA